ncbi:unnamed protein product [Caretta caretta]
MLRLVTSEAGRRCWWYSRASPRSLAAFGSRRTRVGSWLQRVAPGWEGKSCFAEEKALKGLECGICFPSWAGETASQLTAVYGWKERTLCKGR